MTFFALARLRRSMPPLLVTLAFALATNADSARGTERTTPASSRQGAALPASTSTRTVQASSEEDVYGDLYVAPSSEPWPLAPPHEHYHEYAGQPPLMAPCLVACSDRLWFETEYLLWWTDSLDLPPLVTTSTITAPPTSAGVLGAAGTRTLLAGKDLNDSGHSGMRFRLGWWLDPSQCRGIEASYFFLGNRSSEYSADSDTFPILARPVFDTVSNSEAAMLIAHPNFLSGNVNVRAITDLQGTEVLYRHALHHTHGTWLDLLVGYRFMKLDEGLRIAHESEWIVGQGGILAGTTKEVVDLFEMDNEFHGGEIALHYRQLMNNCWSIDVLMKLGMGNNRSQAYIDGRTITTVPNGGSATFIGGLLAQETNMGRYEVDQFGLVPELTVTLTREITRNMHVSVGYNLLYWTAIHQLGDHIDRNVSQFPPEPVAGLAPAFRFRDSSFLAEGLQLGMAYQF